MRKWSFVQDSLRQFYADECGAEVVEWTVVTLIIVLATVPVLIVMKETLGALFVDILEQLLEQ